MRHQLNLKQKTLVLFTTALIAVVPPYSSAAAPDANCEADGIVIDSHLHVTSPENFDASPLKAIGLLTEPVTGEKALAELKNSGIDMAVLVSTAYLYEDRKTFMHENDYVAGLVKAHPDKFMGLCTITPSQPWAMEELERCIDTLGLNGLKLHLSANKMDLTNPEEAATIAALFTKAAEVKAGLPILIDFNWIDDAQTAELIQLAMANPGVNIIMAHGLGHHYKEFVMVELLRKLVKGSLGNLYADLSATFTAYPPGSPSFDDYIWHLRKMGAGQLLFGSDYPVETPGNSYEAFLKMGFNAEEQKQIQGANAAKLFGCSTTSSE